MAGNTRIQDLKRARSEASELMNRRGATLAEFTAKRAEIVALEASATVEDALGILSKAGREFAQPKNHALPFKNFGEQMLAIAKACTGRGRDPRLDVIQNASGMNEGIGTEGGFLVQQDFAAEIIDSMFETAVLAPLCRRVNIGGTSNSAIVLGYDETSRGDGFRFGGIRGYWAAEAAEVTASKPKLRQMELVLNKLMALCYVTDELLRDSLLLDSMLRQAFAEELSFLADDAIFCGSGAGKPLGITKSDALILQDAEAGQAAGSVVHDNIANMWSRVPVRCRRTAVWLIHSEIEPKLESMALAVGAGGTLSPYAREYAEKGTIKGRPVIPIEHALLPGEVGDIVLADFTKYLLADKSGVDFTPSMHVQFLTDEMAFRVIYRVDGQPAIHRPAEPYRGTAGRTQSAFIALAAR